MDEDTIRAQALAEWLGSNAPAAAGLGLLFTLACTAALFGGLRHLHLRLPRTWLTPGAWLVLWLAVGGGFMLATAAVFAQAMDAMDADEALGVFDSRLAQVLSQQLPAGMLRIVGSATHVGDPLVLIAVVVVVAAMLLRRGHRWLALGWLVACAGNGVLNQGLKRIFARVRPLHEHGFAVAEGYSFPSGHTSGSVVVYGMLAYLCVRLLPARWHLPAVLVAAGLAYSMGISRVILQVHWASDVLAGFASGLAWMAVCIAALEVRLRYTRGVSTT